jgi:hypothetical protein
VAVFDPLLEPLVTPVTVAVFRSRKADIVQSDVRVDFRAVLDDLQQTIPVAVVSWADVGPIEVRAVAGGLLAVGIDGDEFGVLLAGGVVAEAGDHAHRLLDGFGRPPRDVLDLVEGAVEIGPPGLLLVSRDDAVHICTRRSAWVSRSKKVVVRRCVGGRRYRLLTLFRVERNGGGDEDQGKYFLRHTRYDSDSGSIVFPPVPTVFPSPTHETVWITPAGKRSPSAVAWRPVS